MRELEKMIEKYRQELVEFSKQSPTADEEVLKIKIRQRELCVFRLHPAEEAIRLLMP